ncbi:hypothetical protein D9615_006324 [Tricholomella constricta]|uniref:OBG-type G domain-containing protein n=1 Tax=Tricholomella constricta TaxID=117010 RepID=A0A8H5M1H8_9AGAR|nr:hypothetical protein D9615_006324 [Tricholomella constricta]
MNENLHSSDEVRRRRQACRRHLHGGYEWMSLDADRGLVYAVASCRIGTSPRPTSQERSKIFRYLLTYVTLFTTATMGIVEKIKEIEQEMARTQKNKATEYHLGLLKAKLARYRAQLLEPASKSGPTGTGFDVQKSGDARVALIGFPSVGKSTLLSKVTHTASETAAYEFTTLTAIPGVIEYKGARIQLLDLPGIVEGASQGRGRGRQVVATAKTADLILIMLDATKSEEHRRLLEFELDAVGIRLNKNKPDVVFKRRTTGGITFNTTVKLTKTDEKTIRTILAGYKLHNCDVMIREDEQGNTSHVFIDSISIEQLDKLARQSNSVVISCEMDLNLDYLIERMWDELKLVKVYTKKRGVQPDLSDPVCLRKGATIESRISVMGLSGSVNLECFSRIIAHVENLGKIEQVFPARSETLFTPSSPVIYYPRSMAIDKSSLADPNGPSPVEIIFLGTGTSSSLPHIECITASPDEEQCRTCLSTLTSEGKKNIRRNTSAAFRMTAKDGRKVTIVIDAGKNFQASALEWFPKYGLRRIDALLITHPHADAMNGLDDLRGWTLNNAIQSHIDVYVSQDTFVEVQRSFPYLVSKEFASGGGDVPEFKWHIINDTVSFEVHDTGIQITPFTVHHGRIFSVAPPPAYIPSPSATHPSTPTKATVALPSKHFFPENGIHKNPEEEVVHPYLCYGFKIGKDVVYISDVSLIPDDKWDIIESRQPGDDSRLPVLVLDCLRLRPHTSHFGLESAVDAARRIRASRTYFVGFGHEVAHDEYVTLGEAAGGKCFDVDMLTETEKRGMALIRKGENVWVRPAHDGLRVFVEADGRVFDESY